MQDEFGHGRYQAGALAGVAAVSREMSRYPPVIDGNPNGAQRRCHPAINIRGENLNVAWKARNGGLYRSFDLPQKRSGASY